MSYTSQANAQDRRNALMERILMRKFNAMQTEYDKIHDAEKRLKQQYKEQAVKDKSNPDFDPNVNIEYNPNWFDNNKESDDDDDDYEQEQEQDIKTNNNNENINEDDRIHLSDDGIDKIKSFMLDMPKLNDDNVPKWAQKIPEDVWKKQILENLENKNDDVVTNNNSELNDIQIETKHKESTLNVNANENEQKKPINVENKSESKKKSLGNNKGKNKGKNKNKNKGKSKGKGRNKNNRNKNKNNRNKNKNCKNKSKKSKK